MHSWIPGQGDWERKIVDYRPVQATLTIRPSLKKPRSFWEKLVGCGEGWLWSLIWKMKRKVLGRAEFTLGFQAWKMLVPKGRKQELYMDTLQRLRMEVLQKTRAVSIASYNYAKWGCQPQLTLIEHILHIKYYASSVVYVEWCHFHSAMRQGWVWPLYYSWWNQRS